MGDALMTLQFAADVIKYVRQCPPPLLIMISFRIAGYWLGRLVECWNPKGGDAECIKLFNQIAAFLEAMSRIYSYLPADETQDLKELSHSSSPNSGEPELTLYSMSDLMDVVEKFTSVTVEAGILLCERIVKPRLIKSSLSGQSQILLALNCKITSNIIEMGSGHGSKRLDFIRSRLPLLFK